jgi:hypothetical protein
MLINSQVFYYHLNAKTCILQLVLINYNHFLGHFKNLLYYFIVIFPLVVK